jgi:beta-xylosidase
MKTRSASVIPRVMLLISIVVLTVTVINVRPVIAVPFDFYWQDNFTVAALHPLWSIINNDSAHWSLTANPQHLRIITQPGGLYESSNSQKNIFLTRVPDVNFRIFTSVSINPGENHQGAGLLIYQDMDNYISINRAYNDGNYVNFEVEIEGSNTVTSVDVTDTTVCLILMRSGNTYVGEYGVGDCSFVEYLGLATVDLDDLQVGIGANGGASSTEINADFDTFKLEGNFQNFGVWSRDDFNGTTLKDGWSWINEDPLHWSLSANPGYMRIETSPKGVGGENLLVQDAPATDFWMETRQLFEPTSDFQIASLVLAHDDQNFMNFGREYCDPLVNPSCVGNGIYFDHIQAGAYIGVGFATPVSETDEAYLRVLKNDTSYYGFYRSSSTQWRLIGRHEWSGVVDLDKIGITASQGFSAFEPADFDYFLLSHVGWSSFLPMLAK